MNPAAPVTRIASSRMPAPITPHVDDVLPADLEATVRLMRRAEDEDVALLEHAVERDQPVVIDIGIRGQDARAGPRQELAHLVGEGRPGVVRLGLERHAEDADGLAAEACVAAFERRDDTRANPR